MLSTPMGLLTYFLHLGKNDVVFCPHFSDDFNFDCVPRCRVCGEPDQCDRCSSGEGNPFSSITVDWLYSGKMIFPPDGVPLLSGVASTTTKPTVAFGDFKSDLSLSLTPPLFGGVISCKVTHNNPPEGQTWSFESDDLTHHLDPPSLKFPPTITDSTFSVLEGSSLNFSFIVEANPFPDPDDFQWYSGSKVYPKGQYQNLCQSIHGTSLTDASSDMSVVWTKDDVALKVASTSMSWSDLSTFVASLVLNKVTNQDRGSYKCRGKNMAGEGNTSAPANFEVYGVPSLVSFTPNKNLLEPSEGEILPAIECVVSGQPKPIIKWVKNNHDVNPDVYNTITVASPTSDNQTSFIVSSSFEMKRPLVADDAGNYTCQATLLNGDTISMRAILVADITWYKDGKPLEISKDQQPGSWRWVNDTRNNWLLIHESNVAIRGVLKTDEGQYTCYAENTIGYTNRTTYLTVKTPPEPPTINSPISATWESIDLSWTPGSDGGYPQTYRIFYHVKGGNYNVSNPALLGSGLDGIINVTEGTSYNITGLLPDKTYIVRVTGINLLGISRDAPDQKTEIQVNTTVHHIDSIDGITYIVRNTAIYFPKVQSSDGELCVYLRTDNQSSPSALNFTCRDVGAGQYEYAVRIPTVGYNWVASYCLQRRNDVCGPASPVAIDSRPISTESAIALGVVCSLVFLVLVGLVIVIALWCRQRKNDEDSMIPPAHQEKSANLRRWSHLGQNRDSCSDVKNQRGLVSDSVSSKDSDKLCFESGTMSSSCAELNKSASERGSHGFKNKVFYCDSSNALELTDQPDSSSGQQENTDKVYHEVVV